MEVKQKFVTPRYSVGLRKLTLRTGYVRVEYIEPLPSNRCLATNRNPLHNKLTERGGGTLLYEAFQWEFTTSDWALTTKPMANITFMIIYIYILAMVLLKTMMGEIVLMSDPDGVACSFEQLL